MTTSTTSPTSPTSPTAGTSTTPANRFSNRRDRRIGDTGSCSPAGTWPKQRILFLLAGTFTLAGTALAAGVSSWFAVVPAAVGLNQLLLVATGWCPASAVLDRVLPAAGR